MKCSLHAGALAEYRQAVLYYGGRAASLGEAFIKEVEAIVATIQNSPRSRAANERGVRRHLLKRFPYVVHYTIEQTKVGDNEEVAVIYAVRHARRDQSY